MKYLINLSFETGCFPNNLKKSIIKPIYKKDNIENVQNYRPIALVSVFSKIFEKAMHKRLVEFSKKFNIMKKEQHAFQSSKSTSSACFQLIEEIVNSLDSKKLTSVVFIDMTKAFDFVSHAILLSKLEQLGIRGPALNWIQSYLNNREQCVEIEKLNIKNEVMKYQSSYKTNEYGVPQGSVLGPLEFLFYINDLPDVTDVKTILFADDISLLFTMPPNTDIQTYQNFISYNLSLIVKWFNNNNLHININKTKLMNFSISNRNINDIRICHNEIPVESITVHKFLGIHIDRNCKWNIHIEKVCNKLNSFTYVLRRLKNTASIQTAITAYYGYVHSILSYGLLIWGNSSEINKAFIVQKKCLRAVCGMAPYESCRPLFSKLNILTLPCMYILETAKFVKSHPEIFEDAKIVTSKVLRTNKLLLKKKPKTVFYLNNCYAMCVKIYNALPSYIRLLPKNRFNLALKKWLIEKRFYCVKDLFDMNLRIAKRMKTP